MALLGAAEVLDIIDESADEGAAALMSEAAGVAVLVAPYRADGRDAAMLQFPGGYIAEVHAVARVK